MPDDSLVHKGEKAIGGLFKEKWVLYGGIGIGALAVFLYLQSQAANAAASGGSTGVVPGLPVSYGGLGGPVDASGGGGSSGQDNSALLAAIAAQTANDQATQQANLAAISAQANAAIAADQTNLDMASIAGQVSNYANSTNVLDSFLKQAGNGGVSVLGFTGSVTPTGYGGVNTDLYASTNKVLNAIPYLTGQGGGVLHPGPQKPIYAGGSPGTVNPVLTGAPTAPTINPTPVG